MDKERRPPALVPMKIAFFLIAAMQKKRPEPVERGGPPADFAWKGVGAFPAKVRSGFALANAAML
ncbi:hypothetical protein [Shinella zoogloeoides]|uniref:hypothetical protein n=1 Tax=Shinella zoogloeoides TaxID=352475 RepID=UPI0028A69671|nr:hypothetical protein [Shinella zoogloeoides]